MSGGGRVDRTLPLVLIALASLLPGPVAAQDEVTELERFSLCTGCAVNLLPVIDWEDSDVAGGPRVREIEIETAVRSRLRAARIYDPEATGYLYISVGAPRVGAGNFFLGLVKQLQDPATGARGSAETWQTSGRIDPFEEFRKSLDVFMDQYLRVNECGQ